MLLLLTGIVRVLIVMVATWLASKGAFTMTQFTPFENGIVNFVTVGLVSLAAVFTHVIEVRWHAQIAEAKGFIAGMAVQASQPTPLPAVSKPTPTIDIIDK